VGFVFQAFNLLPRLTVVENVALPLLYRDNSDPAANLAAARTALERVGMSHRLDHRPTQLSGGERQRVAVARAIVGTPSIIFADEPTGNLDVKNVDRVLDLLGSLIKEGITVVLVTHDLSVAEKAHRVISMRAGLVQEDRVR
jgi:putative ABC transport system ATP-binding protein